MAPQSNTTMLETIFGSRDLLCTQGGQVDFHQYSQCQPFRLPSTALSCEPPSKRSLPYSPMPQQQQQHQQQLQLQSSIPPKPLTKRRYRRVTFHSKDSVQEIPNRLDYTHDELRSMYLSRDEMNQSHEECWRLVDLMNSGIEYEDHENFSKRGLIDLKDDSVDRRRKIRDQTYQIVLGVQEFHASNSAPACMDVVGIMAGLYHKAAQQARDEAIEAAWFDAVAVRM